MVKLGVRGLGGGGRGNHAVILCAESWDGMGGHPPHKTYIPKIWWNWTNLEFQILAIQIAFSNITGSGWLLRLPGHELAPTATKTSGWWDGRHAKNRRRTSLFESIILRAVSWNCFTLFLAPWKVPPFLHSTQKACPGARQPRTKDILPITIIKRTLERSTTPCIQVVDCLLTVEMSELLGLQTKILLNGTSR